ncbi:MAG: hypothetical protein IPL87_04900 [Candidatus Moraniibacteriota bacterium]|nr:MAG: hypothetical protein IPL87_04900 [Candidatus Moranbacteria bacterium]
MAIPGNFVTGSVSSSAMRQTGNQSAVSRASASQPNSSPAFGKREKPFDLSVPSKAPEKRLGIAYGDRKIFFERDIRYENPKHNRAMQEFMRNPAIAEVLDKPEEVREFNRLLREKSRETRGGGVTVWGLQEVLQEFRSGAGKTIDAKEARKLAWTLFPKRFQTRYRTRPHVGMQSPSAGFRARDARSSLFDVPPGKGNLSSTPSAENTPTRPGSGFGRFSSARGISSGPIPSAPPRLRF